METRASHFLVGLFVLSLVVIFSSAVLWLAKTRYAEDETLYYIYFRGAVTGLQVGSAVRYRGVPVGSVTNIAIDSENVELIEVTVALRRNTPVKVDTVASLALAGITGGSFVQLTGGTQTSPPLTPRDGKRRGVIRSVPSQLEQVFENAPELLSQLALVATRAAELLNEDNQQRIANILDNVSIATGALAKRQGGVETLVTDAGATLGTIRDMATSLDVLAKDMSGLTNQLLTDSRKLTNEASTLLTDGSKGVRDLQATAQSFRRLADEMERLVNENRGSVRDFTQSGLFEMSQFFIEARSLVASLQRVASQIERDPARFLFGDQTRGVEAK
jgi:phospholipid/cholesterol/gamma-HCH transport system substrate-binding protein